ncbi:uncharacterized protein At5g01610-like isoform X1 [Asparagus officinalis]|uniref:uncharacterized protein At5g01610-like isoform X1 n=1 Tax=Asparagus officinalis TaxID=4686 RepID=UPI00098E41E1|nr:uncharacterized protein At5g01610-like isoform X1 [Asparagus officinalis]
MDMVMNKVGTYMLQQNASKELSSVTNEIGSFTHGIGGGKKWLVDKVKGKMQKPLPNLLKEYDLPVGLFPQDVSTYEFKEGTKQLTVNLPLACEVRYRDQSFVRFNTTITGFLEKGRMYDVEGIKTKISVIWPMVSCVTTEGTKIHLQTTVKRTTRERAPYEMLRDSIGLDKF